MRFSRFLVGSYRRQVALADGAADHLSNGIRHRRRHRHRRVSPGRLDEAATISGGEWI
jgi:hypothetical protein